MESPSKPPEPPSWNADDAAARRSSERAAKAVRIKPASPKKGDQSAAGEEDPGSALDSLREADGQPEAKKPSKS